MEGLEKIANRITAGIVLAALILGAALLMRVETSFRIVGYPGLAMLFFLAAVAGGVWLVVRIVVPACGWPSRPRNPSIGSASTPAAACGLAAVASRSWVRRACSISASTN
jgi:hypothetical protein